MAQDAAADGPGQLGSADKDGRTDVTDRPHLIDADDAVPYPAHRQLPLVVIVMADEFIHDGCRKVRQILSLEIR